MTAAMLAMVFAAGFVIMTPIGPVSTICIRRTLIYGRRAGIAAGAGDAVAVAIYATIGVTGSTILPRLFAPYAVISHIGIAVALVAVAVLIWRSRPVLPKIAAATRSRLAAGFGAAFLLALANPADIVLFAALFAGLGVVLHSSLEYALFFLTIFTGGCAYWVAFSSLLNHWRTGLTPSRMVGLNRTCAGMMLVAAAASVVSLVRGAT